MRRLALALIVAFIGFAAPGSAAPDQRATSFATDVRAYLSEYEARDPLFADSIGIHTHDDALPDWVRQRAEDARVAIRNRLEEADRVVREKPDGAAGEGRQIGVGREPGPDGRTGARNSS